MSLCFAAITPHPPLLIPDIGKDKVGQVEQTQKAMQQLEQDIYLSKAELIVIISPHGGLFEDTFVVNAHSILHSSFDKFGDLVTKKEWKGAPNLAATLSHESHLKNVPLRLVSNEQLDHGTSVPLFYLTDHLPDVKVLPVGFSHLDANSHIAFGELLKDTILQQDKRVAVIASGDLSHRISDNSPDGYSEHGQKFDDLILQLLESKDASGIINIDPDLVQEASQCGWRSILILLGIIKDMDYTFKKYSYEAPLGVGYLVGNFVF